MLLWRFLKMVNAHAVPVTFAPLKSNDVDSANLYINISEIEDPASIVKRLKDNDA